MINYPINKLFFKKIFIILIILMILSSVLYAFLSSLADLEGMRGLSRNSQHSKDLYVFDKFLSMSKDSLSKKSLYRILIKEAYIEKSWSCGYKCQTAKSIGEVDSPTLILVLDDKSMVGDLQKKYFIEQENGTSEFQGLGDSLLVSYIYSYSKIQDKPLKFLLYLGDNKNDRILLDSITFR